MHPSVPAQPDKSAQEGPKEMQYVKLWDHHMAAHAGRTLPADKEVHGLSGTLQHLSGYHE